jgi:hypothetical protein
VDERELPPDWFCEGQSDLTDLVDTEHITGSMPADEGAREQQRQEFYAHLRGRPHGQSDHGVGPAR